MADLPPCSHMLIVQDDVILASNLPAACRQIAGANPDRPVCLFLSRLPRDTAKKAAAAMKHGQRYVTVNQRSFLPIVGVLWPRAKLVEFAEWAEANPHLPGQREPRSDDGMAGRWKMVTRQHILACVPSIVEHPDVEASTVGLQPHWGKNNARVAALFTDDAARYDWSA
jgi:hypothetical protein